jgi:hypothetical protein
MSALGTVGLTKYSRQKLAKKIAVDPGTTARTNIVETKRLLPKIKKYSVRRN